MIPFAIKILFLVCFVIIFLGSSPVTEEENPGNAPVMFIQAVYAAFMSAAVSGITWGMLEVFR